MSEQTAKRPAIRVVTGKVPAVLADRIGKAAYQATMAWMKDLQKGGKDENR